MPAWCRLRLACLGRCLRKPFEALAAGTPPIVAKGCEAEPLVCENRAGVAYEPGDARELAANIQEMACDSKRWAEMRDNALRLSKRFDRSIISERAVAILTAVANEEALPEASW